jgi:hypothetical protein
VHVIAHQALRPTRNLVPRQLFSHLIEVDLLIALLKEGALPLVAALGNVMRAV